MTVTKDANKDYTRVAWTSPNTSGVISPLMALNDDPSVQTPIVCFRLVQDLFCARDSLYGRPNGYRGLTHRDVRR